jgi:hypothetical protein
VRWQEDAAAARKAAAERKAVAPAYAQLMHALCARGMHADALSVHALAGTHGVYAPGNPTHYRALFKALRGAGAEDGGSMPPLRAAEAAVAAAARAAEAKAESARRERGEKSPSRASSSATRSAYGVGRMKNVFKPSVTPPPTPMDVEIAATAVRATLHVAAAGGFPELAIDAVDRLTFSRAAPRPEDLECALEAFERAGDAAGAVALWNERLSPAATATTPGHRFAFQPTKRAWTALIKAHCDAGEADAAAALLEDAVAAATSHHSPSPSPSPSSSKKTQTQTRSRGSPRHRKPPSDGNKRRDGVELIAFNLVATALARVGQPRRAEVCSIHWFPYDRVRVVNADP